MKIKNNLIRIRWIWRNVFANNSKGTVGLTAGWRVRNFILKFRLPNGVHTSNFRFEPAGLGSACERTDQNTFTCSSIYAREPINVLFDWGGWPNCGG
jgi:hypothetical protein